MVLRGAAVLGIMVLAWLMLWFARDGLNDNRGTEPNALDVLYFSVVTVTTLGYGDIVPVSPAARAIVTFGITPLRIIVWLLLLSTAYEFALRRSIERLEMERLKRVLKDHVLICGFGVKGRSAVKELMQRDVPAEQIIVIDPTDTAVSEAARLGLTIIQGNAASEQILRDAAVEKAKFAIVVPNNDEACVLICLTIRELAPHVKIQAAAREEENVKLIARSGADTVVAPSVSGGRLLAGATSSPWATDVLEQLFEHGRGTEIFDVAVTADQAGKIPSLALNDGESLVLAVRTAAGVMIPYHKTVDRKLELGDVMVVYTPPAV